MSIVRSLYCDESFARLSGELPLEEPLPDELLLPLLLLRLFNLACFFFLSLALSACSFSSRKSLSLLSL